MTLKATVLARSPKRNCLATPYTVSIREIKEKVDLSLDQGVIANATIFSLATLYAVAAR